MLTGTELLAKVKELGEASRTELVRATGYMSPKKGGGERLLFSAFYDALLEARGITLGRGRGGDGKVGRRLSYATQVLFNGNLTVGRAYTALVGLKPGDAFHIQLGRRHIKLIPMDAPQGPVDQHDPEDQPAHQDRQEHQKPQGHRERKDHPDQPDHPDHPGHPDQQTRRKHREQGDGQGRGQGQGQVDGQGQGKAKPLPKPVAEAKPLAKAKPTAKPKPKPRARARAKQDQPSRSRQRPAGQPNPTPA